MKNIFSTFILITTSVFVFAQQPYKTTYNELKEFEGIYEYINHTTLKIAVSPKDTILYAIVNQSRYPLKPASMDVFLNTYKVPVEFLRDKSNTITGYVTRKDTFRLITKNVFFPKQMWYPRIGADAQNYHYQYTVPANLHDDLKTSGIAQTGLDSALLNKMMNKIVAGDYPNVHSILIIKGDKLVFEEYFYEYGRDSLQEQRSATKSIVSALTGIALHQKLIKSIKEPVLPYFPEYKLANYSDLKKRITIEDLITNQSGLNYDAAYDKSVGNETAMNYSDDWVKYTLDLPMIDTPGRKGRYNSGNPITMGRIIEKTSGQSLPAFAIKNLLTPMGITHFKWNFKPDKSNAEDFCQIYLRPRDMAKFGMLYLNNGVYNNRQLIPAEWVIQSLSKHSVVQGVDYGYLWWLKYLDANGIRYYGKAAQGNGGQKIYIFQQQQLVIVITGGNYNTQSPSDELIKTYILPAFNKK